MEIQQQLSSFKWIIQGNLVVPTGNPFDEPREEQEDDPRTSSEDRERDGHESSSSSPDSSSYIINLGPKLEIRVNYVIGIDYNGIIVIIEPASVFWDNYRENQQQHDGYIDLSSPSNQQQTSFVCPGLIDLHIHAPQYAFCGTGTDRPLMGDDGWLETYTFPVESRLKDDCCRTKQVYDAVVKRTLSFGTTTAMYFATIDVGPTKTLVDTTIQYGQRAIIGKVAMDRNSPLTYCQSTEQNLEGTREIISYIQNHPSPKQRRQQRTRDGSKALPLVLPMVVPRFIPTCTPELLEGLGKMVSQVQRQGQLCYVTSHVSESIDEVEYSRLLIQQDYDATMTDAEVFDKHGLLTDRCIMAHGVLLSDNDVRLMKDRGSAIAHCPLSNYYFAGHTLPCRSLMTNHGVKIGLGTDVAGGYHPSIIDSSRITVLSSLSLLHQRNQKQESSDTENDTATIPSATRRNDNNVHEESKEHSSTTAQSDLDPTMDYRHAFYLATLGGANALSLDQKIGTFQVGMEFDAIVLGSAPMSSSTPSMFPHHADAEYENEIATHNYHPDFFQDDSIVDRFQKLWLLGDDRNVRRVFVQGQLVKSLD